MADVGTTAVCDGCGDALPFGGGVQGALQLVAYRGGVAHQLLFGWHCSGDCGDLMLDAARAIAEDFDLGPEPESRGPGPIPEDELNELEEPWLGVAVDDPSRFPPEVVEITQPVED